MSQQSQGVQPSAQSSVTLPLEAIKNLTEMAQTFTQALLDLSQKAHASPPPQNPPKKQKEADQIRSYRVPGFMVMEERKILQEYRAEDVVDLLRKARDDFSITSLFMRRFSDGYSIDGFTVRHIGDTMSRPIVMLNKVCSILADYEARTSE